MRLFKYFLFIIFVSCNNGSDTSQLVIKNDKGIDEIAILQNFIKQDGTMFYRLTNDDVKLIEKIIRKENDSLRNLINIPDYEKPEPLSNYIRQYLAYINREGEKEVFIFCVSRERKYSKWREEFIMTIGGGNSVFKGVINITREKSLGFSTNSPL